MISQEQIKFTCINISGLKRLNGSQVLEGNLSYILNDLKKIVLENNPDKKLIHLFNTNFVLDNICYYSIIL